MCLSREKNRLEAEVVVHARQDHTLKGVGTTDAWGTSLTAAVKKVLQQAETVKGKWQERKRSAVVGSHLAACGASSGVAVAEAGMSAARTGRATPTSMR